MELAKAPHKAIIVDDEKEARDILAALLSEYDQIEVISKEPDVNSALKSIIKHRPDVIFLDIEMPDKDGFDLVTELREETLQPTIIFVTAYNEHAIKAFKVAAFDYILKPIDKDELRNTITRFLEEKSSPGLQEINQKMDLLMQNLRPVNKIRFNTRTGFILIDPEEVVYCEADCNYTKVHLNKTSFETISLNIGAVEPMLPDSFIRISRSIIINSGYLKTVDRKSRKCTLVKERSEYCIDVPTRNLKYLDKFN